jgi:hypothetical protein
VLVKVHTTEQLKAAIKSGANDILVENEKLVAQLKAINYIKSKGSIAVAAVVAAIPFVVGTGGVGGLGIAAAAPGAVWATSAIIALVVATGAVIAISLFTDWEYVELPGGIKLKRRKK